MDLSTVGFLEASAIQSLWGVLVRQSGLHAVPKALAAYKKHGQSSAENPGVLLAEEVIDAWLKRAK